MERKKKTIWATSNGWGDSPYEEEEMEKHLKERRKMSEFTHSVWFNRGCPLSLVEIRSLIGDANVGSVVWGPDGKIVFGFLTNKESVQKLIELGADVALGTDCIPAGGTPY